MINFCRSSLSSLFLLFIYLFVFGESPAFAAPGELCGSIGGIVRMQDATIPQRGGGSLNAKLFAPDASRQTAALVTFGGAYAVLAYVTQALTTAPYNWLTQAQAVDGLALAETTPGPLIMVLQFIGFMAAWNNPGDMNQTASAITGTLVTTYVTFLPCFIFIFVGAPYIEYLRGNKNLTGALRRNGDGCRCDFESRAGLRRGGDFPKRIDRQHRMVCRRDERRRVRRAV